MKLAGIHHAWKQFTVPVREPSLARSVLERTAALELILTSVRERGRCESRRLALRWQCQEAPCVVEALEKPRGLITACVGRAGRAGGSRRRRQR